MKRSNRLLLLLGVALAAVAFVGVLAFGSGSGQAQVQPPVETVPVVVTTSGLTLGTAITADKLTTTQVPITEALDTFRDPSQVEGLVVRRNVAQGEQLTTRDFQTAGMLAAAEIVRALQPGQRAMAVEVDALSAVGGLVQAGDRVDVILSVSDDDSKFPVFGPGVGGSPTSVEDDTVNNTSIKVLVQNVPVLALVAPEPTEAEAEGQASAKEPQAMAILGVTPEQTELIRFAQLDGNLTLVLRAPGDQTTADVTTNGVTLRRLVEEYGVLPPRIVVGE